MCLRGFAGPVELCVGVGAPDRLWRYVQHIISRHVQCSCVHMYKKQNILLQNFCMNEFLTDFEATSSTASLTGLLI